MKSYGDKLEKSETHLTIVGSWFCSYQMPEACSQLHTTITYGLEFLLLLIPFHYES